jgi:adenylate kinase family enzyme
MTPLFSAAGVGKTAMVTSDDPFDLRSAQRIALVGCIGAGKSTLARMLGERLGLEVFHLDRLWWLGGGYRIVGRKTVVSHAMDPEAFLELQQELAARDRWIIDGGRADLSVRLARAGRVIFLDLPRRMCMWRIAKRTGSPRPDYPPDVQESWRWMIVLLRWVWNYPRQKRPGMIAAVEAHAGQARVIWCRSASDVRRLVQSTST